NPNPKFGHRPDPLQRGRSTPVRGFEALAQRLGHRAAPPERERVTSGFRDRLVSNLNDKSVSKHSSLTNEKGRAPKKPTPTPKSMTALTIHSALNTRRGPAQIPTFRDRIVDGIKGTVVEEEKEEGRGK